MKIDHITLLCSSLQASDAYYATLLPLLGFHQQKYGVWSDGEGFVFQFREAAAGSRPYERYGAGMNHLGFAAPSVESVAAIRQAMQEAGFEVPAIQTLGAVSALFMKDPDGIRFEISHTPAGASVVD